MIKISFISDEGKLVVFLKSRILLNEDLNAQGFSLVEVFVKIRLSRS